MICDCVRYKIEIHRHMSLLLTLLVAGCSSGGSVPPDTPDRSSMYQAQLDGINAEISELANRYIDVPFTPEAMIPTTGVVAYDGFWSGVLSNGEDQITDSITGELHIDVSFTDDQSRSHGVIQSFRDSIGAPMSGSLELYDFRISRSGNASETIGFTGAGDLVDEGGSAIAITAQFGGNFVGLQAQGVAGEATGYADVDQQRQAVGGSFIAEQ